MENDTQARNLEILRAHQSGASYQELADLHRLSGVRIRQICEQELRRLRRIASLVGPEALEIGMHIRIEGHRRHSRIILAIEQARPTEYHITWQWADGTQRPQIFTAKKTDRIFAILHEAKPFEDTVAARAAVDPEFAAALRNEPEHG